VEYGHSCNYTKKRKGIQGMNYYIILYIDNYSGINIICIKIKNIHHWKKSVVLCLSSLLLYPMYSKEILAAAGIIHLQV